MTGDLVIEDWMDRCRPYWGRVRVRDRTHYIVIHRADPLEMSINLGAHLTHDIEGIAHGDWVIKEVGSLAYAVAIDHDGTIQQGRPLSHQTPHARATWNPKSLAVCMIGDFRDEDPTDEQWSAAVRFVALLVARYGLDASHVLGHDECLAASKDASKRCPGDRWPMPAFRIAIQQHQAEVGQIDLAKIGVIE